MKYESGSYMVYIFSPIGSRNKDIVPVEPNYLAAIATGKLAMICDSVGSYVVMRCLLNSSETEHHW